MAVTSSRTAPKYSARGQRTDGDDPGMESKRCFLLVTVCIKKNSTATWNVKNRIGQAGAGQRIVRLTKIRNADNLSVIIRKAPAFPIQPTYRIRTKEDV